MDDRPLSDSPITAVECASDGTVYFAAGNVVFRNGSAHRAAATAPSLSSSAAVLPYATTVRCVSAPPSTVITTLAIASRTAQPRSDLQTAIEDRVPSIIFMGAADRLLTQLDVASRDGSVAERKIGHSVPGKSLQCAADRPAGCLCVLHTAESRILRIAVDAAHGVVLVLTASNELFCLLLRDVEAALQAGGVSRYADVSRCLSYVRRVRGPPHGVVLAADILVDRYGDRDGSADVGADVPLSSYRLFAATYTGEVVEWHPAERTAGKAAVVESCRPTRRCAVPEPVGFCVASRVQAHPSGCAIFSVRIEQSAPDCATNGQHGGCTEDVQKTHLVTCSDDRTVALYERRRTSSNPSDVGGVSRRPLDDWVLLWRGSGAAFSKSRVFDVAVRAVWSPAGTSPEAGNSSAARWRCAVHVAAAGEDGGVQAVRIASPPEQVDSRNAALPLSAATTTVCFALARLHRGHGAYRVAFSKPDAAGAQVTLISGGFDGVVYAHSYVGERRDRHAPRPRTRVLAPSIVGQTQTGASSPDRVAAQEQPSLPFKAAQVRIVHVDAAGHLLACTNQVLCVRYRCGGATASAAPISSWWTHLPNTTDESAAATGGTRSSFTYGLPSSVESYHLSMKQGGPNVVTKDDSEALSGVSCLLVGTTTGTLYAMPYAFSRTNGTVARPGTEAAVAEARAEATTTTTASTTTVTVHTGASRIVAATAALQSYGKVTHMTALEGKHVTTSEQEHHSTLFVATAHVRNAVVLSGLITRVDRAAGADGVTSIIHGTSRCSSVRVTGEWKFLVVLKDCPGPLTTTLSLVPTHSAAEETTLSFWMLIGDKNGRLFGVHHSGHLEADPCGSTWSQATPSPLADTSPVTEFSSSATLPTAVSLWKAATVCSYVFAEHLRIAVTALCVEEAADADLTTKTLGVNLSDELIVLRVAGTGGVVEFLCLPTVPRKSGGLPTAGNDGPTSQLHDAPSREPLRLPFEASAVLAMSSRVCVVQSGTTVSVLYRIPGRTSWVLVDAYEDVRAPRLLTARISGCPATVQMSDVRTATAAPVVFFAHCSDGHTIEAFASFPDQPVLSSAIERCVRTSLLHGGGLPGKDYNCVAYAPAPLRCLLMGNEDSSIVVHPLDVAPACSGASVLASPSSLLCRFVAPVNLCGAHHSNILAMTAMPSDSASRGCLRFVSVGGGAMVNLWAADGSSSPLRLLDWWCGGAPALRSSTQEEDNDEEGHSHSTAGKGTNNNNNGSRTSNASFQKKRAKQAVASSSCATVALTERIARFMCVTAWAAHTAAVGSSDGTLLFFSVGCKASEVNNHGTLGGSHEMLRLEWKGVVNADTPKPVLCVTSAVLRPAAACDTAASGRLAGLLVAGDTNGFVYVMDSTTHRVVAQARLEQSSTNALSELQAMAADSTEDEAGVIHLRWRFAAIHDSGVVHFAEACVTLLSDAISEARLTVLSSISTGVTAGRSVRWPLASQPLVAVTEERVTYFAPSQLQAGRLAILHERRMNVRCVSGAVVVAEDPLLWTQQDKAEGQHAGLPRVAVVGQGFEVL